MLVITSETHLVLGTNQKKREKVASAFKKTPCVTTKKKVVTQVTSQKDVPSEWEE